MQPQQNQQPSFFSQLRGLATTGMDNATRFASGVYNDPRVQAGLQRTNQAVGDLYNDQQVQGIITSPVAQQASACATQCRQCASCAGSLYTSPEVKAAIAQVASIAANIARNAAASAFTSAGQYMIGRQQYPQMMSQGELDPQQILLERQLQQRGEVPVMNQMEAINGGKIKTKKYYKSKGKNYKKSQKYNNYRKSRINRQRKSKRSRK